MPARLTVYLEEILRRQAVAEVGDEDLRQRVAHLEQLVRAVLELQRAWVARGEEGRDHA